MPITTVSSWVRDIKCTIKRNPSNPKLPLKSLLIKNGNYTRSRLRKRLIEEGLLENKCNCCGIGPEWNGQKLTLQLDHINGVSNDNRLKNLRILCPNCHSQTDNYGEHNKGK